jgi:hypothetical protein
MSCYYCNYEGIYTEAAVPCVVCNNPACPRPSGRADRYFHGERCRERNCNLFVCEFDVHDHLHNVVVGGAGAAPTCFPYLTVGTSFDALRAAEHFAGASDAAAHPDSNRALTRATQLLTATKKAQREQLDRLAIEHVKDKQGTPGRPYRLRSEYFDAGRVLQLCFRAAAALSKAWPVFCVDERPRFVRSRKRGSRMEFAADSLDERMADFVAHEKMEGHVPFSERLGVLSERLALWAQEVLSEFKEDEVLKAEPSFDFRSSYLKFQSSEKVRSLEPELADWELE